MRAAAAAVCLLFASCSDDGETARPAPLPPTASGPMTFDQPIVSSIDSIVWSGDGYVAAGSGTLYWTGMQAFQVWRSDDGFAWSQIFLEEVECCDRSESVTRLLESPYGLLAWTHGGLLRHPYDWFSTTFLRSSADGGHTWVEHRGGPWGARGVVARPPVVVGSTVLVAASRNDAPTTELGTYTPSLWRSDDLDTWHQIEVPDPPADGWVDVAALDELTLLVQTDDRNDGTRRMHLSTDGGETFSEVFPPHPERRPRLLGTVDARFLLTLERTDDEWADPDGPQTGPLLATSRDGRRWDVPERNTGLWGDAAVRIDATIPADDWLLLPVWRTMRNDLRYCVADVTTCRQGGLAVVALARGAEERELIIDLPHTASAFDQELVAGPPGTLLVWSAQHEPPEPSYAVEAHRWDGLGAQLLHRPAPQKRPPEPSSPIRLLHRDVISVGERFHTQLPIGLCSGDRIRNDERWYLNAESDELRFGDLPEGWPFLPDVGSHGPRGYLVVEGERIDQDTFRFFVDDETTLEYRYDPRGPQVVC
jgi:hypothetical protein